MLMVEPRVKQEERMSPAEPMECVFIDLTIDDDGGGGGPDPDR